MWIGVNGTIKNKHHSEQNRYIETKNITHLLTDLLSVTGNSENSNWNRRPIVIENSFYCIPTGNHFASFGFLEIILKFVDEYCFRIFTTLSLSVLQNIFSNRLHVSQLLRFNYSTEILKWIMTPSPIFLKIITNLFFLGHLLINTCSTSDELYM